MPNTPTAKEFLRLRKKLNLSVQTIAIQMRNSVSFNTLFNFERGLPVSDNTKKEIAKWIDSKKNLVVKV
jgi:hypothetical protein